MELQRHASIVIRLSNELMHLTGEYDAGQRNEPFICTQLTAIREQLEAIEQSMVVWVPPTPVMDEALKQLFISSYTGIYERDPHELTGAVRDIINRYSIDIALAEIRNIVKGLYFPNIADLERLAMEYEQVVMTPHRSLDGYYATFIWRGTVQRTPDLATPMAALAQAQHMIDKIKNI